MLQVMFFFHLTLFPNDKAIKDHLSKKEYDRVNDHAKKTSYDCFKEIFSNESLLFSQKFDVLDQFINENVSYALACNPSILCQLLCTRDIINLAMALQGRSPRLGFTSKSQSPSFLLTANNKRQRCDLKSLPPIKLSGLSLN